MLLHVSELEHHYGVRIASRENDLWFAYLYEAALASTTAVAEFAEELLRELWNPQTKSFVAQQLKHRLHEGGETESWPMTSD